MSENNIELESGEKVFAHINTKALRDSATVGIYLLPVGVWCERLKRQAFSPYSIPWDTDLSWLPGVSGGERTVTKQLLKHYRDDF